MFWRYLYRIMEMQNNVNRRISHVCERSVSSLSLSDKGIVAKKLKGFRLPFGIKKANNDGTTDKYQGGEDLSKVMSLKE